MDGKKQRWVQFFDSERKYVYIIHFDESYLPPHMFHSMNLEKRIDLMSIEYEKMLEREKWLDDDRIPCPNGVNGFTGTEIFAEAFGCKVVYPDDNMPFALPLISSADEAEKLKVPHWSETPLKNLFDTADKLISRFGKDITLKLPDIQSPLDIAALIWDKNEFYPAMIESPEAVLSLSGKVYELLTATLDEWFRRYGRDFIAHYPDYYMPYGITLSEDEIGAVNCGMFNKFFLPELISLSERYGAIGIHCCAHAAHHWELMKKIPNLKLVNLNPGADKINSAYKTFENHAAQWHGCTINLNPDSDLHHLPQSARVVVEAFAPNKEDALMLSEKLFKLCR